MNKEEALKRLETLKEDLFCEEDRIAIQYLLEENKNLLRMCELYSESLYNAELKQLEQKIDNAINEINITIEVIEEQPTEDDTYILYKLKSLLEILRGKND